MGYGRFRREAFVFLAFPQNRFRRPYPLKMKNFRMA